ncbi:MAG TPA: DNA polymerase III subunit delta [Sulfuriferula sp.]|nr:DNA polymerase III subunit delta [Sulfuriferula sp.]
MRVKPEQLAQHLARGIQPLYTVYGDEPLLALEAADLVRVSARAAGYSERDVHTVEARFNWNELLTAGDNLSLFGDRRLADIRIPSGKPGLEGGKALQAYCARLPADTVTLISLPKLDRQATNAKWFTALEANGVVVGVNPVSIDQLPRWIGARLAAQNLQADSQTLRFLTERVEGNLLAAQQEIRKLALLFPPGNITFDNVREAVLDVARYDVFKLSDALLAGDVPRLMRMLDGLRNEGESPVLILWTLTRELRILTRIKAGQASGRPAAQLMREAGVWESRQALVEKALARVSLTALTQALRDAAAIDRTIKGLQSGDVWDALGQLALKIAPPGKAATPSPVRQ